jgi:sulfoxide reductase heme-binding subunit YedZ
MSSSYTDPGQHLFWLASRAAGVVALLLIALSVGLGLAMSGRLMGNPRLAARMRVWHEALALAGLVAIAAHGLLLLGDGYLHPGIAGIAVPFALASQPMWTGLGIVGGWLAAILGLSFYVRRWIGTRAWRWLHRWTLAVYLLSVAHTLGSGSDARSAWLLGLVGATAIPITFLTVHRALPRSAPVRRPRVSRPPVAATRPLPGEARAG